MTKTVQVNEDLYKNIVAHCKTTGTDVDQFVEESLAKALPQQTDAPVYQQHDAEEIKERLKSLGYID